MVTSKPEGCTDGPQSQFPPAFEDLHIKCIAFPLAVGLALIKIDRNTCHEYYCCSVSIDIFI